MTTKWDTIDAGIHHTYDDDRTTVRYQVQRSGEWDSRQYRLIVRPADPKSRACVVLAQSDDLDLIFSIQSMLDFARGNRVLADKWIAHREAERAAQ